MRDQTNQPLPKLPPREANSHKGTYGRLLLVGGSRGMAGAISLSGMAALRSGAGLVTIATPGCVQHDVACFCPAYMTLGLDDDDNKGNGDGFAATAIQPILEFAAKVDVVAIGPGLGKSAAVKQLVKRCYDELPQTLVVDADALNALAPLDPATNPGGQRILTPHPGEFDRLLGDSDNWMSEGSQDRHTRATELAKRDSSGRTVVVLKGAGTVVADGERYTINATGNPGMATGGTGDVLTGVIAALAAQGLATWDAARLGVHVHGLAGDLAAEKLGQVSLMAPDLVDYLPAAFQQLNA